MSDGGIQIPVGFRWDVGNINEIVAQVKRATASLVSNATGTGASEAGQIRQQFAAAQRSIAEAKGAGVIDPKGATALTKDLTRHIKELIKTADGEVLEALRAVETAAARTKIYKAADLQPAVTREQRSEQRAEQRRRDKAADKARADEINAANARRTTPLDEIRNEVVPKRQARAVDRANTLLVDYQSANRPVSIISKGQLAGRAMRGQEQTGQYEELAGMGDLGRQIKTDIANGAAAAKRFAADIDELVGANDLYRGAMVDAARSAQEVRESVQGVLAADDRYVKATAGLANARRELADRVALEAAGISVAGKDRDTLMGEAEALRRRQRDQRAIAGNTATSPEDVDVARDRRTSDALHRAELDAATALDDEAIGALALAAASKKHLRELVRARSAQSELNEALEARADAEERQAFLRTKEGRQITEATVRRRVAEAQVASEVRQQEKVLMNQLIRGGELGGTRFQRAQAMLSPGSRRTPEEFQTIRQFAGTKGMQTLGYGISGAIFGGMMVGIANAVQEVATLQKQFINLEEQLKSMGQGAYFDRIREDVKSISVATGAAASDTLGATQRFLGLYRNETDAAVLATRDAEAAMKLMQIAGVDYATVIRSLVPLQQAFGLTTEEVGDRIIAFSQRMGVGADELVNFAGKAATVWKRAGGDLDQLLVIGTNMAQELGKDLGSSAEPLNKMPELVSRNYRQINAVLRSNAATMPIVDPFQEAVGSGQEAVAVMHLLRAVAQEGVFSDAQKLQLAGLIGNPREIEDALAIINSADSIVGQLEGPKKVEDIAGTMERQWGKFSENAAIAVRRLDEAFNALVDSLAEAGLADAFVYAAKALGLVLVIAEKLLTVFGAINNVTKIGPFSNSGLVGPLVGLAAGYATLRKAVELLNGVRARHTKTVVTETVAEKANTSGKVANTVATTRQGQAYQKTFSRGYTAVPEPPVPPTVPTGRPAPTGRLGRMQLGDRARAMFAGSSSMRGQRAADALGADAAAARLGRAPGPASWGSVAGSFGGMAIATAGIMAVSTVQQNESNKLKKASDDLREQMRKKTYDELKAINTGQETWIDSLQSAIFDVDMPGEVKRAEMEAKAPEQDESKFIRAINTDSLREAYSRLLPENRINELNMQFGLNEDWASLGRELGIDASPAATIRGVGGQAVVIPGRTDPNLRAKIPEMIKRLEGRNDGRSQELKQKLKDWAEQDVSFSQIRAEIDKAIAAGDRKTAADLAGGYGQLTAQDRQSVRSRRDAGITTQGQYIGELRRALAAARTDEAGARSDPEKYKEWEVEVRGLENDLAEALDQRVQNSLEIATKLANLRGVSPSQILEMNIAALRRMSPKAQQAALPGIIDQEIKAYQAELDRITDPGELRRRQEEGLKFSPEVQDLMTTSDISTAEGGTDITNEMSGYFRKTGDEMRAWIAETVRMSDESTIDAVLGILEQRRKDAIRDAGGDPNAGNSVKSMISRAIDIFSPEAAQAMIHASGYFNKSGDEMKTEMARIMAEQDLTLQEAMIQVLEKRLNDDIAKIVEAGGDPNANWHVQDLRSQLDFWRNWKPKSSSAGSGPTQAQVDAQRQAALDKSLIDLRSAGSVADLQAESDAVAKARIDLAAEEAAGGEQNAARINEARAKLREAEAAYSRAAADLREISWGWAHVWANGDPIAENLATANDLRRQIARAKSEGRGGDAERLEQDLQRNAFEAQDLQNDIVRSNISLLQAQEELDPVAAARRGKELADNAVANAKGTAARNEALAAQIRADRSLNDAISDGFSAKAELAMAIAEANSDSALAAQIAAQEAQRNLDEAIAAGVQGAPLDRLKANVATANATAFRTSLSQEREAIDFMLDMGQITLSQALDAYRRLLSTTKVGTDEYRDLMRAIKALEGQAQQDYQFNLPSQLGLPTLYESRRSTQSAMQGIGYQDNRNVVVSVAINGTTDPMAIGAQVIGALQSALKGGPTYAPVGMGVGR